MTEIEFLLEYRKSAIMGGDNVPRRPPIWACSCGCKRFRKVNPDGSDAPVKVKMLKNIKPAPLSRIMWESGSIEDALANKNSEIHSYAVGIETEEGLQDTMSVTAVSEEDAVKAAHEIIANFNFGQREYRILSVQVIPDE